VVAEQGPWAVVTVQDQGVGIPTDELPQVFTPFFRAATAQGIAGTGLGLWGAQAIVAQHGGKLDLASTVGVGTTVTLRLPRERLTTEGRRTTCPRAAQLLCDAVEQVKRYSIVGTRWHGAYKKGATGRTALRRLRRPSCRRAAIPRVAHVVRPGEAGGCALALGRGRISPPIGVSPAGPTAAMALRAAAAARVGIWCPSIAPRP
jgi:Histidine kinase-, DNA gyrase B-, and HSP90-like ATPase